MEQPADQRLDQAGENAAKRQRQRAVSAAHVTIAAASSCSEQLAEEEIVSEAENLARLTGWEGQGTPSVDWKQAEEEVGIALPPDFCELAELFPFGVFQGYLDFIPSPAGLVDLRERPLADLRRWRDNTLDDDEIEYRECLEELAASKGEELPPGPVLSFPFPLWPELGGIFPWALGSRDEIFF
jgi:hypothetical protein